MRAVLALAAACGSTVHSPAAPRDWDATCAGIAADIEKLAPRFSQLADFRADTARTGCRIDYERHTHPPTSRGGWSSGVPAPDPDGIWFYLDIYDPNGPEAMSQINTQPAVPNWWIGERKVMFLALEGDRVTPAGNVIFAVLQRHGLVVR